MLVCGTGYTGEDGVELLCAPERRRRAVGRARAPRRRAGRAGRARHAAPGGLLPPLRQRPDASSAARSKPGSAGAARRTPASSAPRPCAPCARPARPRSSSRSRSTGPGSRARATRSPAAARSRAARCRRASASASAWPTCPPSAPPLGSALRDRRSWQDAPRRRQAEAALPKGLVMAEASYPDDLLYHAEHDWARIDADDRARDARHHLVRAGLARRGRLLRPARRRHDRRTRTSPTPRSSRSRRSPT